PDAKYVGSAKCQECHQDAFKVWQQKDEKDRSHSVAYESLVKATKPSLRQFDGECIVCHVVGFGIDSGFKNEKQSAHLKDVGCESCHGPGSEHIKKRNNMA